jgi:hypothetical protein
MSGASVQGTFATGQSTAVANMSEACVIPTPMTTMRLTLTGLDGSNTVRTRKRTAGGAFVDQVTYNSNQTNVAIAVVPGEEWVLQQVTQQATRDIRYAMVCEG